MYHHLTFPEYVTTILTNSVRDFKPGYMERFKHYNGFDTEFPDFESFMRFYSRMLLQAKERVLSHLLDKNLKVQLFFNSKRPMK